MQTFLDSYKPRIDTYITDFLSSKSNNSSQINTWQHDVYTRLSSFAKNGKTIRGSLVLWSIDRFRGAIEKSDIALAAAFELIHSGFLIHDDIMDNDRLRRGSKTLFAQYENIALEHTLKQPTDFGKNMALCTGDLAIFLGIECLTATSASQELHRQIVNEFASVCIAQMQDVSFGMSATIPAIEEVLSMYTYKTARYTISLPLLAGARIANTSKENVALVESIGEHLGLLFQLTDDMLNLFGDSTVSGKSVDSDLREEKKTFAYVTLMNRMSVSEHETINHQTDSDSRVRLLQSYMESYKIRSVIEDKIEQLVVNIHDSIKQLSLSDTAKLELQQLVLLLRHRSV